MNLKLFLTLLLLSCACPALAAPQQLNLFIWSEYIDPKVVTDFEKQFKCKVTVDLYDDEAAMMTKLQGGGPMLKLTVDRFQATNTFQSKLCS